MYQRMDLTKRKTAAVVRYDETIDRAPVIVARGTGAVADKILNEASRCASGVAASAFIDKNEAWTRCAVSWMTRPDRFGSTLNGVTRGSSPARVAWCGIYSSRTWFGT